MPPLLCRTFSPRHGCRSECFPLQRKWTMFCFFFRHVRLCRRFLHTVFLFSPSHVLCIGPVLCLLLTPFALANRGSSVLCGGIWLSSYHLCGLDSTPALQNGFFFSSGCLFSRSHLSIRNFWEYFSGFWPSELPFPFSGKGFFPGRRRAPAFLLPPPPTLLQFKAASRSKWAQQ